MQIRRRSAPVHIYFLRESVVFLITFRFHEVFGSYGHVCLRRWARLAGRCTMVWGTGRAHGVSVRPLHQWASKPSHRKSVTHATREFELQKSGATVLDRALVSKPVTHARSNKTRSCSVAMVDMSCKSFRQALCSAWSRVTGEQCLYLRRRKSELSFRIRSKAPVPSRPATSALMTVSTVVARCLEAHCNAARRHLGQQPRWEPRRRWRSHPWRQWQWCTAAMLSGGTRGRRGR